MPAIWYSILLGVAIKASAVLAMAWFAAVLLRGSSAAMRHLVWTVAAAAVLALPIFTIGVPSLQLRAVTGILPSSTAFMISSTAATDREVAVPRGAVDAPTAGSRHVTSTSVNWTMWPVLLWAFGAVALFAQMLAGCVAIWSMRRSAQRLRENGLSGILSNSLGIRHEVDVLETRSGNMPMTFGIFRPFILIPAHAAQWTDERRRVVLLHELAHVRRGDVAMQLLARTALCLYWWNPLAWMAWRSFVQERERAADDLVLAAGARASEYAAHLLDIARGAPFSPALDCAAVAMVRHSQLEDRLRAILDVNINRNTPGRAGAMLAVILAVILVAPFAAIRAQEPQSSQVREVPADVDALIRSAISGKTPELLDRAAKTAVASRNYDTARKFLESAMSIRAEVFGEESTQYAAGLMNLADLDQKQHLKSAETSYAKAAQILGERPEAARAYLHLGVTALGKKDFPQSIEYFQHVQRVDSSRAGEALMWMAVVRQRENNMDEAAALYVSALSQQDPNAPEASTTRRLYGQFLRDQGRADEATDIEKANVAKARPQSSPANGVYRAGGGVTAPSLLQKVEPEYSEDARAARLTGTERLYVEVGPDGRAHNARVVQGLGLGLDENGIDAINQWQFQPGSKDGQPVTVAVTIEINWRLM